MTSSMSRMSRQATLLVYDAAEAKDPDFVGVALKPALHRWRYSVHKLCTSRQDAQVLSSVAATLPE